MMWFRPTKSDLRVTVAQREVEVSYLSAKVQEQRIWIDKIEGLLEYERERADQERDRADRLHDAYLQSNGMPATTHIVREEQDESERILDEEFAKRQRELAEIYSETLDDIQNIVDSEKQ